MLKWNCPLIRLIRRLWWWWWVIYSFSIACCVFYSWMEKVNDDDEQNVFWMYFSVFWNWKLGVLYIDIVWIFRIKCVCVFDAYTNDDDKDWFIFVSGNDDVWARREISDTCFYFFFFKQTFLYIQILNSLILETDQGGGYLVMEFFFENGGSNSYTKETLIGIEYIRVKKMDHKKTKRFWNSIIKYGKW